MHINAPGNVIFQDLQLYMGFILSKTDDIPVFCPPVGLGCAADIGRFQNICLSLGIVTIENVGSL